MLNALGQAMPPQVAAPPQWRLNDGQLRLSGWALTEADQQAIAQALNPLGYQWRADGNDWLILPRAKP